MAVKTTKSAVKSRKDKQKYFRVGMLLFGVVLALAILGLFLWGATRTLFSQNDHFLIRHIVVRSSGWWDGRNRVMASKLNLTLGQDNLFGMNLYELRKKIARLPGVESSRVERVLPDTLRINIIERIPRAFLKSSRSPWVVDSHGIVMERRYCLNLSRNLPVILGFDLKKPLSAGMDIPEIQPALDLIMETVRYFPDFKITAISVRDQEKLAFFMHYNEKKQYKVFMPRKNLKYMLTVLRSAILKARRNGDQRSVVNLTYNGNVVFR